jgi:hypothetical protein
MHPQGSNDQVCNQGDAMHCCKFCLSEFDARPQVKNPRACLKPECQLKRQRANEREWRERHPALRGTRYHAIRRAQRTIRIQAAATTIKRCLQVGVDLMGVRISVGEFSQILENFLLDLGVRQINKFWDFENVDEIASLDSFLNQRISQTS